MNGGAHTEQLDREVHCWQFGVDVLLHQVHTFDELNWPFGQLQVLPLWMKLDGQPQEPFDWGTKSPEQD